MTDIPQEVREAAANYARFTHTLTTTERLAVREGRMDKLPLVKTLHAMFLAGKRAGMERAAEIADERCIDHPYAIAQAIRSENDGHG